MTQTMSAVAPGAEEFARAALEGLSARPKRMEPKWFYDAKGAELFEDITELDEYYPTRTEIALLEACAGEIADGLGAGAVVVELGSGSSRKTPILLRALERPAAYVALDIAPEPFDLAAEVIRQAVPGLKLVFIEGDFTHPFDLPDSVRTLPGRRVGFFPGSTIGNLAPLDATALMRRWRAVLGEGAAFILGVDTPKDEARLTGAYDDARGVTAAFNLNLLARMNAELGADFDLSRFRHRAVWNAAASRVEMHLESLADQTVTVADRAFAFARGETIHTENSYKYAPADVERIVAPAGWRVERTWIAPGTAPGTAPGGDFAVYRLV